MSEFWWPALSGACGGFTLGVVITIINMVQVLGSGTGRRRTAQLVITHLASALVLALLGSFCAFFLTGRAGDFLMGITALSLVLLIGGEALSKLTHHEGAPNARSAD